MPVPLVSRVPNTSTFLYSARQTGEGAKGRQIDNKTKFHSYCSLLEVE